MSTITMHLPAGTPLALVREFADRIGCDLRLMRDGTYSALPRHTNANVVKMPRRRRQYVHAELPQGPDGPEAA